MLREEMPCRLDPQLPAGMWKLPNLRRLASVIWETEDGSVLIQSFDPETGELVEEGVLHDAQSKDN